VVLESDTAKIFGLPSRFAKLGANVGESFDLGPREEQSPVLVGEFRRIGLDLAREHAAFVAVAEYISDAGFEVLALRATMRVVMATHRVGMDALKEKGRAPLVTSDAFFVPRIEGSEPPINAA
jgi:hypothetical protein